MNRGNSAISKEDLDTFYSSPTLSSMRRFLGPTMHFHHGFFPSGDESFDEALDDAVRMFYPNIPEGASVLDIGCGWCGPMKLLAAERGVDALGVTVSTAQADFCRAQGFRVVRADAESYDYLNSGLGPFDVALMVESLEHMHDKQLVLQKVHDVASTLLLRTSCRTDHGDGGSTLEFGGSLLVESCDTVLASCDAL